jgi:hypothetical protein
VIRAVVAFSALAAVSCASSLDLVLPAAPAGAPAAPGPWPRLRSFDAVAVNARCEGCHGDIAAEWRSSLHHLAHTDPVYQSQLAREPFPFCRGCHAPEADPRGEGPEELRRLGVGCVTCHVAGERILAAEKHESAEHGSAMHDGATHDGEHHALTRTAAFAGAGACGACHEFAFPDQRGKEPLLMQSTMKEHAASAVAERSCASCHMPLVPGATTGPHRSHAFAASRDEAFVRSAIVVEQGPFVNGTLTLRLRPGAVGHAFPTGDMLRRLALVIEVLAPDGTPVERQERFLARHFAFVREHNRGPRRVLAKDDRVGAGADPLVISYSPRKRPEGGRLRYVLRYERVADPAGGEDGRATVDGSVLLADGTLPLPPE